MPTNRSEINGYAKHCIHESQFARSAVEIGRQKPTGDG